mgnify:CR=1 FL=1
MEILVDSASACAGQGAECGFFAKGNGSAQIGRGRRPRRPATIPLYLCLPQWGRGGRDAMRLAEFSRWENIPPDEVSRLRRSGGGVRLFLQRKRQRPLPVGTKDAQTCRGDHWSPLRNSGSCADTVMRRLSPAAHIYKSTPARVRAGVSLCACFFDQPSAVMAKTWLIWSIFFSA